MEWTPLLAVIIGSTGIVGAIAAAVQLSRRARLTRSIKAATKVAESVAESSRTRAVLQQAIEMDTLRLAASSIITIHPGTLTLHIGFLVAPIIAFSGAALGQSVGVIRSDVPYEIDSTVLTWTGIIMTLIWLMAIVSLINQVTSVYRMREHWVAAEIVAQGPPVVTHRLVGIMRSWPAVALAGPPIDDETRPHD